jgi:ABC-type multidrug transport system ATPase subunit
LQVSIRQLSKRYRGGFYALRDVDLEIGNGMFGLLGPNGAGKTTLMRMLVTLLKPSSGEVRIDGLDLRRDRARIRQLIGYLPQDFGNFPKLAVWEYLDYVAALAGLKRRRDRRQQVDRLLEEVGLFDVPDADGYDVRLVAEQPPVPSAAFRPLYSRPLRPDLYRPDRAADSPPAAVALGAGRRAAARPR